MRPLDPALIGKVMALHRDGLNGPQIGARLGFDRSKVNYILRCQIGPRPRPVRKLIKRKCAMCGGVDVKEPWQARQSPHCRACRQAAAAVSNTANHRDRWTHSNCRECGRVFRIRKCELESRWRQHKARFPKVARANWTPFCQRACYDSWQRNDGKTSKRRHCAT